MGLTLACKNLDPKSNCPYEARGDTEEELMADVTKHAKTLHGYAEEQLKDPKMMEAVKAAIKQE